MLVEAIALARVGHFLLQSTSQKRFFVVAIYVNAEMVASRYVVMQTEGHDTGGNHKPVVFTDLLCCITYGSGQVSIHRKAFRLHLLNDGVDFLREMYNLTTQITALAGDLDLEKKESLDDIHNAASKVLSLSSTKHRSFASTTMNSIPEEITGTQGPQDEDDLGIFEAKDIQNALHQMNYKIEFIPWGVSVITFSGIRTKACPSILNSP